MHRGSDFRPASREPWWASTLAVLVLAALISSGLAAGTASAEVTAPAATMPLIATAPTVSPGGMQTALAPEPPVLPAAETPPAPVAETTWLCKPGLVADPCESNEETTVEQGDGTSSVEPAPAASDPPIDCFYVYPTVSSELTVNSNLFVGPEEKQIAIDQASRFSQTCKVYAPIYPQLTLLAITTPGDVTPAASEKAYIGVLTAFEEYLAKYNDGRGFVLIGHSQGALLLKQLIKEQIDPNATLRKQLVSAVLLGGNVLVPKGKTEGGDFQNVPSCQTSGQTHCVVAYSSFLKEPPEGADFGRVTSPLLGATTPEQLANDEVLCVNPAVPSQDGSAGPLQRYESTTAFPGFLGSFGDIRAPKAPTPWVSMPGQYTGQCKQVNGASWLQLTDVGGAEDKREQVAEVLGPLWGTHLEDVNVALGNLVGMTALQAATYKVEIEPPPPPPPPRRHRARSRFHHHPPPRRVEQPPRRFYGGHDGQIGRYRPPVRRYGRI
jgi:hypothetical protein